MDFGILYALNNIHTDILDKIMIGLTYLGEKGIFWIAISIILMFNSKTRKCGIFMLISMSVGLLIGNGAIKNIVARERPCWIDNTVNLLIANPKDFSFPSGHTLASYEATVTIFLFNKKVGIPALILATLIGFSRLYLFVHFPTDVLGGAILGALIAAAVFFVGNKIIEKAQKNRANISEINITDNENDKITV